MGRGACGSSLTATRRSGPPRRCTLAGIIPAGCATTAPSPAEGMVRFGRVEDGRGAARGVVRPALRAIRCCRSAARANDASRECEHVSKRSRDLGAQTPGPERRHDKRHRTGRRQLGKGDRRRVVIPRHGLRDCHRWVSSCLGRPNGVLSGSTGTEPTGATPARRAATSAYRRTRCTAGSDATTRRT